MYRDVSFAKAVVLIIAGFDRLARSCNVRLVRSNPALTLVSTLAADSQVPAAAAIAAATMAAQPAAAAAAAAAANDAAAAAVKTATERLVEDNAVDDSWAQIKGWLCDNTSVVSKEAVVRRSGRVYARLRGDDGEASKQMRLAIKKAAATLRVRGRLIDDISEERLQRLWAEVSEEFWEGVFVTPPELATPTPQSRAASETVLR